MSALITDACFESMDASMTRCTKLRREVSTAGVVANYCSDVKWRQQHSENINIHVDIRKKHLC